MFINLSLTCLMLISHLMAGITADTIDCQVWKAFFRLRSHDLFLTFSHSWAGNSNPIGNLIDQFFELFIGDHFQRIKNIRSAFKWSSLF